MGNEMAVRIIGSVWWVGRMGGIDDSVNALGLRMLSPLRNYVSAGRTSRMRNPAGDPEAK